MTNHLQLVVTMVLAASLKLKRMLEQKNTLSGVGLNGKNLLQEIPGTFFSVFLYKKITSMPHI